METWVQSSLLADGYEVSSEGRVRRGEISYVGTAPFSGKRHRRVLPPRVFALRGVSARGYRRINVCGRVWFVHRLVAAEFVQNPYALPHVNHINGVKTDNRASNLEWVTDAMNKAHATGLGLMRGPVRLTDAQVASVRELSSSGLKQRAIARQIGCSQQYVSKIVRGVRRHHG